MPLAEKPTQSPTFNDAANRTWQVKLNLSLLDAVLANTQVDLAPSNSDVSPVLGLLFDDRKLGAVLWHCVQEQAKQRQVDRASFFGSLDGETLKSGWGAVVDAIVFFTQSKSQKMADALREAIEAQMRLVEAGASKIIETLKSQATDEAMKTALEKMGRDLQTEINQTFAG